MGDQTESPPSGPEKANSDSQTRTPLENNGSEGTADREIAGRGAIDVENEITGANLLILHTGLCLCTLLVGLVRLICPWFKSRHGGS